MKRVFLIVLDSCGVGYEPDAADFGDVGANTLHTCSQSPKFAMPNLISMGLGNLDGVDYLPKTDQPQAALARLQELSRGKDTTIGHWEIAGLVSPQPLPTFPHGFPEEILKPFSEQTGRGVLCNLPYSGTEVIKDYGREHVKTGALIVVEQAIRLTEYESTGIQMDCLVSSQVLINIFEHNTPLHDGAIIVRGDRIVSATCYLPLSDNMGISKDLGTRHRAAVGMSEVSDALVITVSEETGAVSVAQGGELTRSINEAELRVKLEEVQHKSSETNRIKAMWKGWRKHAKKNN